MAFPSLQLREDYWDYFKLEEKDIEFLYGHLMETETPVTSQELAAVLVRERIRREKAALEQERTSGGDLYLPKERYKVGQRLIFPALGWQRGEVTGSRPGYNPELGEFEVIRVTFESGETREFAAGLAEHKLNQPMEVAVEDEFLNPQAVLDGYQDLLIEEIERGLESREDFVRIAGRWFPRALLVDINIGHLNLAEAVLDMAGGGPLPTSSLLEQIELPANVNPKLLEFSLDLALQEDERFDEVGPAGKVLWFLRRLEPEQVLEPPIYLRYSGIDYDRSVLTQEMLALERDLDDELSPLEGRYQHSDAEIRLIFPHWRAGTLPLASRIRHLFPTAYEAPRIRFTLVDGDSGERFPAWVVRNKRYVYGLKEWYLKRGLQPGSLLRVQKGGAPGEVILHAETRRPSREWVRTVLVGSDGGVVFAMLKQVVQSRYDERMVIAVPDSSALDPIWEQSSKDHQPLERVVLNMVRELSKLTPQGHVHAIELYAAINVIRRCPPGPMLAVLASRPWFNHVGDLHFRLVETEHA